MASSPWVDVALSLNSTAPKLTRSAGISCLDGASSPVYKAGQPQHPHHSVERSHDNMKAIIFATLLALAVARPDSAPQNSYSAPRAHSSEEVTVVKDDRVSPGEGGQYSLDLELSDGTKISESGYGSGPDGAVETQGRVQYISPEGTPYDLSYVSNAEGGYQPESSALPVAPAFPHEIPQFVLDQIAKAAREDAEASSEEQQRTYQ